MSLHAWLKCRLEHQLPAIVVPAQAQRAACRGRRRVRRKPAALARREVFEEGDPIAKGDLVAADQVRARRPLVDRDRVEELRSQLLVCVAEPEVPGGDVDEPGRDRGCRRERQVGDPALAACDLERVGEVRKPVGARAEPIRTWRQRGKASSWLNSV